MSLNGFERLFCVSQGIPRQGRNNIGIWICHKNSYVIGLAGIYYIYIYITYIYIYIYITYTVNIYIYYIYIYIYFLHIQYIYIYIYITYIYITYTVYIYYIYIYIIIYHKTIYTCIYSSITQIPMALLKLHLASCLTPFFSTNGAAFRLDSPIQDLRMNWGILWKYMYIQ